jgi:peptidyl-prolyl cis-trans isomerase SurA
MVDAAFASIAQRVKLTPANLSRALTQSGVDPSTLRTRLRAQMVWQQAVMQRFRQQIRIADSDVVEAIKAQQKTGDKAAGEQTKTIEYRLQQVILVVPAAQRASAMANRRREAEALRAQINGCDGLAAATASMKEAVVKNVGHRTDAELPENFSSLIAETPVGKLTKPIETTNGLEMLAICDRKERESDFSIRTKVEGDLRQKQGELLTRQYMQELRRFAVIEYKR